MYKIAVPITVTSKNFDPEKVLRDLRLMGANRVFLALDFLSNDKEVMEGYYRALQEPIRYFQSNGLEVGVWFWTFRFLHEDPKFTVMVNANGDACHTSTVKYCPLDEGYLSFMEAHVRRLASMHPDLILFDDDLAFGFTSMAAPACFCALHRKKMGEILGEAPPRVEGLYEKMFSGKKNRYRSAFMKACGESLKTLAIRMRAAVDLVDPRIRMGACGCITTFDYDGVDSFTLSKLFAGETKPLLRLIGAPYWDPVRLHGNTLCDVIELERMQRAWHPGNEIEIFTEGDTYPRPRHRVPASYLELFDAALRADGTMNGILKYALSYHNHADYERGYVNAHLRNLRDHEKIETVFAGLSDCGVRVYETMRKIEDSDYSNDPLTADLIRYQFFSRATRFLAHNSIPAAHRGSGCAGIVFGENARALDLAALEKPLILDEHAARILSERGVDVGVEHFGSRFIPVQEYYLATGEYESVTDYVRKPKFASRMELREDAMPQSHWITSEGEALPASYLYENSAKNKFLVLCLDAFHCADEIYKNYSRQKQFVDFLSASGAATPVTCVGNPELYVLCKQNEQKLAVGFFNCFADPIDHLTADLSCPAKKASFFRCNGVVSNQRIQIDRLAAFDWCFVEIEK